MIAAVTCYCLEDEPRGGEGKRQRKINIQMAIQTGDTQPLHAPLQEAQLEARGATTTYSSGITHAKQMPRRPHIACKQQI